MDIYLSVSYISTDFFYITLPNSNVIIFLWQTTRHHGNIGVKCIWAEILLENMTPSLKYHRHFISEKNQLFESRFDMKIKSAIWVSGKNWARSENVKGQGKYT